MAEYEVKSVDGRKLDLMHMYVLQSALHGIKKELEEKGVTFDEFVEIYDEMLTKMEQANASSGVI